MRVASVKWIAVGLLLLVCTGIMPDIAAAQMSTVEVYTYGNGHIMEKIFNSVAMFSNTSANSLLRFAGITAVLFFFIGIMMGDGRPQAHFIHFLVIGILYFGMFIPKVNVMILDQTRAPGAAMPHTATVQNVPAGLGYMASLTSRLGKRTTELMEQAFSEPGYVDYTNYGLAIGPRLITIGPSYPTREMSNMQRYIMDCFYPMLQNGWGGKSPQGLTQADDILLYITPSSEVMNLPVQYQSSGGTLQNMTCNEVYVNVRADTQTWLSNQGPQEMAARMQMTDKNQLLSVLGPAYFAYTGMNVSGLQVIQQRTMFQSFRNAMTMGTSGTSNDLMNTFAFEANKYALEQSTIQVTAQMFKAYLPIFRSVYQAILFGLFPVVLAMAFLNTSHSKIIGTYFRHMIWIEMWDPVFAIHNYVAYMYQSSELSNQFANAGMTVFNLETSSILDSTASFDYAVVLLTAPVAVSFAYFLASATESIGEGVLSGVASRVSSGASGGGGEGLVGRGTYSGAAGSLTDQHLASSNQYGLDDRGELQSIGGGGGSGMRTPVSSSSMGTRQHQGPGGEITTTQHGEGGDVRSVQIADANQMLGVSMGGDAINMTQSLSKQHASADSGSVAASAQTGSQISHGITTSDTTSVGNSASRSQDHAHSTSSGMSQSLQESSRQSANLSHGEATKGALVTSLSHGLSDAFNSSDSVSASMGLNSKLTTGRAAPPAPNPGQAAAGGVPTGPGAPGSTGAPTTQGTPSAPEAGPNSSTSWVGQAMMQAVPIAAGAIVAAAVAPMTGGVGSIPAGLAARAVTAKAVQSAASQLMPKIMSMAQNVGKSPTARAAFAQSAVTAIAAAAAATAGVEGSTGVSHNTGQGVNLSDQQVRGLEQAIAHQEGFEAALGRTTGVSADQKQSSGLTHSTAQNTSQSQQSGRSDGRTDSTSQGVTGSAGHGFTDSAASMTKITQQSDAGRRIFGEMVASGHAMDAPRAMQTIQRLQEQGNTADLGQYLSTLPSSTAKAMANDLQQGQADANQHRSLAAPAPAASASPLAPTGGGGPTGSGSGPSQAARAINTGTDQIANTNGQVESQAGTRDQHFSSHAKEAPRSMDSWDRQTKGGDSFAENRDKLSQAFQDVKPDVATDRAAMWNEGKGEMSPTVARNVVNTLAPGLAPPAHAPTTPTSGATTPDSGGFQHLRDSYGPAHGKPTSDGGSTAHGGSRPSTSGAHSPATPQAPSKTDPMSHAGHGHDGRPHPGTVADSAPASESAADVAGGGKEGAARPTPVTRQDTPPPPPSASNFESGGATLHTGSSSVGGSRGSAAPRHSHARAVAAGVN